MKLLINVLIIAIIFIIQTHSLYFFSNPFCNSRKCLRPTFQRLTYRPITNARTDHRTFTLGKSECNVGTCVNYYYCTVKSHKPPKFCSLRNGFSGVCCKQKGIIIIIVCGCVYVLFYEQIHPVIIDE